MSLKKIFEYRHYDMPDNSLFLALLGENWVKHYKNTNVQHFHNYLEIGYCRFGQGTISIEDKEFSYDAGSLTFIPSHVPHATVSQGETESGWEYLFVDIKELVKLYNRNRKNTLNAYVLPNSSSFLCFDSRQHPLVQQLVLQILEDIRYQRLFYEISAQGLLITLYIELLRLFEIGDPSSDKHLKIVEIIPVLPALEYVDAHLKEAITIGQLADCCHLSESHFRRIFYRCTGIPPLEYIHQVRIQHACKLMQSTDSSISSIALKTGFSCTSTFNRNFIKIMGTNPGKWRSRPQWMGASLLHCEVKKLYGWL